MYGTWLALIVDIDDYEGKFYPETKQLPYKMIQAWIKEKYGFTVNGASISQTKKKYGPALYVRDSAGSDPNTAMECYFREIMRLQKIIK